MEFETLDSLKSNADSLSYAEDMLGEEDYTFGDLRDDVDNTVALTVLATRMYVDDENQEIGVYENAFDFALENESGRRGVADRPIGLESLAVVGGAAGTVASALRLLEEGGLEYLGTGALSAGISLSGMRRIGKVLNARGANSDAGKKLDKRPWLENYKLKLLGEDEALKYIEDEVGEELDADVKAYTAEDLEEMSEEELMEEFEN